MNTNESGRRWFDVVTVIAMALAAYVIDTFIHEHLGHAAACYGLGGFPNKLGAFYVDCQYPGAGDLVSRLVALAGPVASVVTGIVGLAMSRRANGTHAKFFWLLVGAIGWMTGVGYVFFSGVSGIGDLGFEPHSVMTGVEPQIVFRILLAVGGITTYMFLVRKLMLRFTELFARPNEDPRHLRGRIGKMLLIVYASGAIYGVVVGLFNPEGVIILVTSALAATLGGTSGFAWGPFAYIGRDDAADRIARASGEARTIARSWPWIIAGFALLIAYGVIFGQTLTLSASPP